MLVRVVENKDSALPEFLRGGIRDGTGEPRFDLTVGSLHVVYAVANWDGCISYAIIDDVFSFPVFYPALLFEIADGRMPDTWVFRYRTPRGAGNWQEDIIITFPEWANDVTFYGRLVDGENDALRVFEQYRVIVDHDSGTPPEA